MSLHNSCYFQLLCVIRWSHLSESVSEGVYVYLSPVLSYPGFNPRWDCTFKFLLHVPELVLVRFVVEDHDYTARNEFLGQFTLPFTSMRTGNL